MNEMMNVLLCSSFLSLTCSLIGCLKTCFGPRLRLAFHVEHEILQRDQEDTPFYDQIILRAIHVKS